MLLMSPRLRLWLFVTVAVAIVRRSLAGHLGSFNETKSGKDRESPIELGGVFGGKKNNGAPKGTFKLQITKTISASHVFTGLVNIGPPNDGGSFNPRPTSHFNMIFDTASSDILVMGQPTENSEKKVQGKYIEGSKEAICTGKPRTMAMYYDTSGSGAWIDNEYSDGSSYRGKMATDSIHIGPLEAQGVDLLVVDEVNSAAGCARGNGYDGILGLSRGVGAGTSMSPGGGGGGGGGVLAQILQGMKKPIFSFYIRPDGIEGEIMFGGVDKKRHSGMNLFPVVKYDQSPGRGNPVFDWRLQFRVIKVGEHVVSVKSDFHARFESTLKYGIYAPIGGLLVSGIVSNTPGAHRLDDGSVVIECSKRKQLKDLVLVISTRPDEDNRKGVSRGTIGKHDVELSFSGEEYFPYQGVGRNKVPGSYCQLFVVDYPIDGYVQPPDGVFALGVPFMKKYYTSFDTRGQIGIGKAK